MKVQVKIIFLLIGLIGAFFIGLLGAQIWAIENFELILKNREQEVLRLFKNLLLLKGQSLDILANDYSRWDEMAAFTVSGDPQWAKQNINVALSTYNTYAAWVFRPDCSLIYSHSWNPEGTTTNPVTTEMIHTLFSDRRFVHFYSVSNDGLLEIRGATIHPTRDVIRETTPKGYFFVARLWTESYVRDIAETIGGEALLVEETGNEYIPDKLSDLQGNLHLSLHLKAWNETPLRVLKITLKAPLFEKFFKGSIWGFIIGSLFSLCLIVSISWALIVWVSLPLKKISKCLKEEDPRVIQSLLTNHTEFGHISRLIIQFFEQEERLKYTADHDALTGILNRGAILSILNNEFSRAKRYGEVFSVLILDLDFFKRINDSYGHLAGDRVLIEVASLIRNEIRTIDRVGRYGGEEFIIITPGCNSIASSHLAARIKEKISNAVIAFEEHKIQITVSIGITEYLINVDLVINDIIQRADRAMYQAKKEGRNRIVIANH